MSPSLCSWAHRRCTPAEKPVARSTPSPERREVTTTSECSTCYHPFPFPCTVSKATAPIMPCTRAEGWYWTSGRERSAPKGANTATHLIPPDVFVNVLAHSDSPGDFHIHCTRVHPSAPPPQLADDATHRPSSSSRRASPRRTRTWPASRRCAKRACSNPASARGGPPPPSPGAGRAASPRSCRAARRTTGRGS